MFYFITCSGCSQNWKTDKRDNAKSVAPLCYTRMKLGEFDPPEMNPYSYLDMSFVQSQDHRQIASRRSKEIICVTEE